LEKPSPQPPTEYKSIDEIRNQMRAQIHPDVEYRKKARLTGVEKALEKKTEEIAKTKAVQDIVKAVEQTKTPAPPAPPALPAPAPAPAVGSGNDAEMMEEEAKDIVKQTMRNKSKSIIEKLMNKEKSKKIKKGSGIKEI
jgi:hypothetical protein